MTCVDLTCLIRLLAVWLWSPLPVLWFYGYVRHVCSVQRLRMTGRPSPWRDIKDPGATQQHCISTVYPLYQYSLSKVMSIASNLPTTHFLRSRGRLERHWAGFTIIRPRRNQTERTQCNISSRSIASLSIYRAQLWSLAILGALEVFLECRRWLNVYFSSGFSATRFWWLTLIHCLLSFQQWAWMAVAVAMETST